MFPVPEPSLYICPLCQSPLNTDHHSLVCCQRHRFDRAKEGYVNLLPVQHKGSRLPGDSAEMIQARRQFLDQGHYQPLRSTAVEMLGQAVGCHPSPAILDTGCGEGYYSSALTGISSRVYGLDVSKYAIKAAAKRYPDIDFCVASGYRLPFANQCFAAITRIYAPSKEEELTRTLKLGGFLLTVTPGPRHLYQFKQKIYQQVQLHAEREYPLTAFRQVAKQQLHYQLDLTGSSATQLLQMTPFAWRAKPAVWAELAASESLNCEVDFQITIWQKQ